MTEKLNAVERESLRRYLLDRFSFNDLKDLAFALDVDSELFSCTNIQAFSRDLIQYFEHRDQLGRLMAEALEQRPDHSLRQLLAKWPASAPSVKIQIVVSLDLVDDTVVFLDELAARLEVSREQVVLVSAARGSLRLLIGLPKEKADLQVLNKISSLGNGKYPIASIELFDSLDEESRKAWRLIARAYPPIRQDNILWPVAAWKDVFEAPGKDRTIPHTSYSERLPVMQDLPLPVEFRAEVLGPLFKTLASGESCSLVGVGSSGKSNIVRHLARMDVRAHYLKEAAQHTLCVYVDCAKLLGYLHQQLYSLVLEAMAFAVQDAGLAAATLPQELEAAWERAASANAPDLARHWLESAIGKVRQAGMDQIFILLDDFDHVIRRTPAAVLNSLRALRDNHKSHLMYATFTRRELGFLRDPNEYQDLYEIVCSKTIAIGPYGEADANFMLDRLMLRWAPQDKLTAAERQRVLTLSGGHAGLLRTILWAIPRPDLTLPFSELIEKLRGHQDIEPECAKIWESLEPEEIGVLEALLRQRQPDPGDARSLEGKGMIRLRAEGGYAVFSPVLAEYAYDQLSIPRPVPEPAPEQDMPWMDERLRALNAVERGLLDYLISHKGRPVARHDLIVRLHEVERDTRTPARGRPEQRLDDCLQALVAKVNADKQHIVLEPDGSCRLVGLD